MRERTLLDGAPSTQPRHLQRRKQSLIRSKRSCHASMRNLCNAASLKCLGHKKIAESPLCALIFSGFSSCFSFFRLSSSRFLASSESWSRVLQDEAQRVISVHKYMQIINSDVVHGTCTCVPVHMRACIQRKRGTGSEIEGCSPVFCHALQVPPLYRPIFGGSE